MEYTLRRVSVIAASAVFTASALSVVTAPAQALSAPAEATDVSGQAVDVTFDSEGTGPDGGRSINIEINGAYAGYVAWNADPNERWTKGDTLYVQDARSDGYAIAGHVYRDGNNHVASASTSGHTAPYTTSYTNNIPENTGITVFAVVSKGSTAVATSDRYSGHA